MHLMGRATAYFVLAAALFAAGIVSRVHAAELLAFEGLTPPPSPFERNAAGTMAETAAGLSLGTGLRLPYRPGERADDGPGFLERDAGGFTLYSGTRPTFRPGPDYSQAFGGLRYLISRAWASMLEASVEPASLTGTRAYALQGRLQRRLPGGWDLSVGLKYNVEEIGDYRLPSGAGDPWGLTGQGLLLSPGLPGTSATGYELRFSLRYGERNSIGLTYGSGRDLDYTRQMLGLYPSDGRQFGLTGQYWLTPDWALSYGLMAQEQIGVYRGQGLRFGLRYNF